MRNETPVVDSRLILAVVVLACFVAAVREAPAAPANATTPSSDAAVHHEGAAQTDVSSSREIEVLVPPQGTAVDIPLHAGEVCILSFPERTSGRALVGSPDYQIVEWDNTGIAVRAAGPDVPPTTVAIATVSGSVKVNVTLRVVPEQEPALILARFKPVSAEEAFQERVKVEIEKRWTPLKTKLDTDRKNLDALIRQRADELTAERMLARSELVMIERHARNGDHVILHVWRASLVGDTGFLVFEVQNRSRAPYRVGAVRVLAPGGVEVSGPTRLASTAPVRERGVVGIVAAGTRARGVVTLRGIGALLNKRLTIEVAQPDGRGKIRMSEGIVLR